MGENGPVILKEWKSRKHLDSRFSFIAERKVKRAVVRWLVPSKRRPVKKMKTK